MIRPNDQEIYDSIKLFADEFILKGNSILTDDVDVLSNQSLDNCFECFVENFKEGKQSFDEKIREQFKDGDLNTCLVFAHAEWLWAFAVDDLSIPKKKDYTHRMLKIANAENNELKEVYPRGFGSAGQWHTQNKYDEIKFILQIIKLLKLKVDNNEINSITEILSWFEKISLFQKYRTEFEIFPLTDKFKNSIQTHKLAVSNIICYVTFPEKYERIASDNHKWRILNSFYGLITDTDPEILENKNIDEKILMIRNELSELIENSNFSFYEQKYRKIWNYSIFEEGFDEIQALLYKKAIILYGPPGTSKTYSAKHLASALIKQAYIKKRENVRSFFENEIDFESERIHHLQLHSNYNYEDFVAGIQLINEETKATKGKLFEICALAEKDKTNDLPHVLILDEINRIDLSRLFGEVFSALENREEPIDLSIGNFKLTIPDNLYVIGTMNEIDFSLEQIDFALRRRFLWFYYGFKQNVLRDIIWQKNSKLKTKLKPEEVEKFISNCALLNQALIKLPELGEQYEIGHTFFAEVVDIYSSYKQIHGLWKQLKYQIFRKDGAAEILWKISISPMIGAFLGNMDKESKNSKLKELEKVFINA